MALEDTFGDIVKKASFGLGISLEALAPASGLPVETLRHLIADDWLPSSQAEIEKLARALGLHASKLWGIASDGYSPKPVSVARGPMEVRTLTVGDARGWRSNCHVIVERETREAVLVDPGAEGDRLAAWAQGHGARVVLIAITHGHQDHWGGLAAVRKATGARVVYAAGDASQISALKAQDQPLTGGERLPFGSEFLEARFTPGHTAGGITYVLRDAAFVGDCLFAGSLGRANVSYQDLLLAVGTQILALPRETALYPGHGPNTTVGEEHEHNPFFTRF